MSTVKCLESVPCSLTPVGELRRWSQSDERLTMLILAGHEVSDEMLAGWLHVDDGPALVEFSDRLRARLASAGGA